MFAPVIQSHNRTHAISLIQWCWSWVSSWENVQRISSLPFAHIMNTQVPWKWFGRPTRPRGQNWSQMLQDWPLSTKIAKHEPPDEMPLLLFIPQSSLRIIPTVSCLVHYVSQLSQHRGLFKHAPVQNQNTYVILPAWLAQKVGCPLFSYLSFGWTKGFVQVWVTCRFSDWVPHSLPANWPPISGTIKQAKLKVTK